MDTSISNDIREKIEYMSKHNVICDIVLEMNRVLADIPDIDIISRVKSFDSAIEKVQRKGYKSANQLTDLAGIMVITADEKDIYKVRDILINKYPLIEENDYVKHPKNGYRSLHLNLSINSTLVEFQIKTLEMKKAQKFTHDNIYKNNRIPNWIKPFLVTASFQVIERMERFKLSRKPKNIAQQKRLSKQQKDDIIKLYDAYTKTADSFNYPDGIALKLHSGRSLEKKGLVSLANTNRSNQYATWLTTDEGKDLAKQLLAEIGISFERANLHLKGICEHCLKELLEKGRVTYEKENSAILDSSSRMFIDGCEAIEFKVSDTKKLECQECGSLTHNLYASKTDNPFLFDGTHDIFGRPVNENTPKGIIRYSYDNRGVEGGLKGMDKVPVKKVSDDLVKMARSVDLVSYCQRNGYDMEREGMQYRLKGYGGLIIKDKMWYWQTKKIGGNALDFAMKVENKSFTEAVEALTGRSAARDPVIVHPKVIEKEKSAEIQLPEFSKEMKRSFAYLILTRGINKVVVNDMVQLRSIKESIEYHVKDNVIADLINAGKLKADDSRNQYVIRSLIKNGHIKDYSELHNVCFLGRDNEGKIRYGMERSTLTNSSFKKEFTGSDKAYNFFIPGKSDRVILCESAIECLSVATIERMHEKNYKKDHKLSCGGVSDLALEQYLKDHPEIKKITIAFNKDPEYIDGKENIARENVQKAIQHIFDTYGGRYDVDRVEPEKGKDWNDVLKSINIESINKDMPEGSLKELLGEYKRVEVYDRKKDIPNPDMNM